MTFKFEVGEEVILQSKDFPEYNSPCVVISRVCTSMESELTGVMTAGNYYKTDIQTDDPNSWWIESALRKKHKPSDQSLEDMIAEINEGVVS